MITSLAVGPVGCHPGHTPPPGDILADLRLPTIDGDAFDAATLRGKPTLVLFFRPTCSHCLAELPHAVAAAHATDANIVAVQIVGTLEGTADLLHRAGYVGPMLSDVAGGALRQKYAIKAVPYTLVLGPDGHAERAFLGEQDEATLTAALENARP